MSMQLYITNKNYSSWSMRAWVLMRQAGIPFEEVLIRLDDVTADSQFKKKLAPISPTGKVPVLVDDGLVVWDSLAIAEYLADKFPDRHLWPINARARARARSICAEMHSGFHALRSRLPMNIEASLPEVGQRLMREDTALQADVKRMVKLLSDVLCNHGTPMLFGGFSIADAFFAPIAQRFKTYGISTPSPVDEYLDRLCQLPAVAEWIQAALDEKDFVAIDEPYRNKV